MGAGTRQIIGFAKLRPPITRARDPKSPLADFDTNAVFLFASFSPLILVCRHPELLARILVLKSRLGHLR